MFFCQNQHQSNYVFGVIFCVNSILPHFHPPPIHTCPPHPSPHPSGTPQAFSHHFLPRHCLINSPTFLPTTHLHMHSSCISPPTHQKKYMRISLYSEFEHGGLWNTAVPGPESPAPSPLRRLHSGEGQDNCFYWKLSLKVCIDLAIVPNLEWPEGQNNSP